MRSPIRSFFGLATILTLFTGCQYTATVPEYTFYDLLANNGVRSTECSIPVTVPNAASNRLALCYANGVATLLGNKTRGKRIIRESSNALQVLTAAAAALLTDRQTSLTAAANLAAASAVIPNLQTVFGSGEEARAYSQGLVLVQTAISDFYKNGGLEGLDDLDEHGEELVSRVDSILGVVASAVAKEIPSSEQLQEATEGAS